jgi:hypothetical protein
MPETLLFVTWTPHTVIHFVSIGTCTVGSLNGTLVEDKMRIVEGECADFSLNKCPIYTHDGASAKFSTSSQDTDNSAEALNAKLHSFIVLWRYVLLAYL